jgi:hypothetical protein
MTFRVGWLTTYTNWDTGWTKGESGFDFRQAEIFLFATESKLALRHFHPVIKWILGPVSSGVKQSGRDAKVRLNLYSRYKFENDKLHIKKGQGS